MHTDPTDEIAMDCMARVAALKQLPVSEIAPESSFEALALDSLDKTTLAFDVEDRYGIEIPESQLYEIKTVGQMIEGVRRLVDAKAAAKVAPAEEPAAD